MTAETETRDLPIKSSQEDRLDRMPFARLVAMALLVHNQDTATVIGITGSYGSGKSSVAAMIRECIGSKATIVEFAPWMVGSRDALAREFFATLGKNALPKNNTQLAKEKRSRFYRYGSKVLEVLATGSHVVGAVVPGVALGAKAAEAAAKALDLTAEGLEAQASGATLMDERDAIAEDLRALKKPVVLIVEDFDRLDRDEVRTSLQLIKACADFPNIRYLLLYDRDQVLHALEGTVNNPSAFLEKIVNQSFDLPEATTKQRAAVLDQSLTDLGLHIDLPKRSMDRLSLVFDQVLLPGLPTVRHIKRFVSTTGALLPGVIVDGFRNIDPADFLALEYLRQYVPSVYAVLRDEESPNPGGKITRLFKKDEWAKDIEKRRDAAFEQVSDPQFRDLGREAVKSLLSTSIPIAQAHSERRFVTGYWKPVYFGFSDARACIKERDWQGFKAMLNGKVSDKWVRELDVRERRDRWVTAIGDRVEDLSNKQLVRLLVILYQWGDQHGYEQGQFPTGEHYSWNEMVGFCSTDVLRTLRNSDQKVALLRTVIEQSKSVVSPGIVIGMEHSRQGKDGYGHWSHGTDLAEFVGSLEPPIRDLVESGAVWSMPDSGEVLRVWAYLNDEASKSWYDALPDDLSRYAKYLNYVIGPQMHDQNRIGWKVNKKTRRACEAVDVSLLDEQGRWAREFLIESAATSDIEDELDIEIE